MLQAHWDSVYAADNLDELGWYEPSRLTSTCLKAAGSSRSQRAETNARTSSPYSVTSDSAESSTTSRGLLCVPRIVLVQFDVRWV